MAGGKWRGLRKTLLRKTVYEPEFVEQTRLKRCLTRWDLTGLGVGTTLGVGVYFIFGHVALSLAGPSVVLSFLIAAVAALFAGLCYAEFAARIPRAGAAYSYTYLAIGEVVAFIIGWNNILEALFASASLARGLSLHIDSMFNTTMYTWFSSIAPVSVYFMSPFFDFFAFLIVLVMGAILAFGVRESMVVNNVISATNTLFVLFIVVVGAFAVNTSNWSIPVEDVPPNHGEGGFFPFGIWGTLKGAAVCFYGYVGFESICAAGEEVQEPRRVIPITILAVLGITFLCYTSVSIVVSMMVPYYLQHSFIAVSEAFSYVNWEWAKWIVATGSLFGLYASLFGAMFPLTRLMYSMSSDGLLLSILSKLTAGRQSPALLTIGCTVVIAILAGLMNFEQLLLMVCIGTLVSYTAVAASVIILRYTTDYTPGQPRYLRQTFGIGRSPTLASSRIVNISLFLFMCIALMNALVTMHVASPMIPCAIFNTLALILLLEMTIQPQLKEDIYFKTPLVPLVPCLSIYINIHLMVLLNIENWIRFGVWTVIGIIIYIITVCCCKRQQNNNLQDNITLSLSQTNVNGKSPVQIIIESPTPPDTLTRISDYGEVQKKEAIQQEIKETIVRNDLPVITEEIILHQAYIENNEEKEAKIIDLLDQVLQAEEDSYGEVESLQEQKDEDAVATENTAQRKSLGEISDAGSDASLGNQGLSKYDVIAQVHREDLPRVNEEEEKSEREDILDNDEMDEHEQVTAFNDSDTNSRTDESGYSDTIDRNALSESLEESKEEIPIIPVPPPLDENYFRSPNFKKSYTIGTKHRNPEQPPKEDEEEEENKPRESVKSFTSNSSLGDGNITFGSDRQIHFMSKLNNIFQNKISNNEEEEPRKRSHSTGNVVENTDFSVNRERPPMFLALKNEIMSKEAAQNLRPVNVEEKENPEDPSGNDQRQEEEEEEEDITMSKEDLKSKLENIFAAGGPRLLKPRLMKSNPPTPEEAYQTDTSSTESIPKLPKMEKNDTLKRQKDKFNEVLNSFRVSLNKDDEIL